MSNAEKNNNSLGPLVADLHGRVKVGSTFQKGLRVSLKDTGKEAITVGNGVFVIKQVKLGNYTLIVEGTLKNAPVWGEQEITLVIEEDFKGVVVPAKIDRPPPK